MKEKILNLYNIKITIKCLFFAQFLKCSIQTNLQTSYLIK